MKKVAIVIDVSGSMAPDVAPVNRIKLFACGMESKEIPIPMEFMGSSIKPVNELAKNFDIVYFFTDGLFYGKPAKNIKVVKIDEV